MTITTARTAAAAVPPTPPGHFRLGWACGHTADAPIAHDWDKHRHYCPPCHKNRTDDQCTGVTYLNHGYTPPADDQPDRCYLCRAVPAHLYPFGWRCDRCVRAYIERTQTR